MKILILGDVMGVSGRKAIKKNWNVFSISTNLPKKKRKLNKVK